MNRRHCVASNGRPTFKREPLTQAEATALANACATGPEKLVVWTLLDTGLRVEELSGIERESVDWQMHRIIVIGKGSKRRVVQLTPRVRDLLEAHIGVNDSFNMGIRKIQRIVKVVANRAAIRRKISPHVLRHTFAVTSLQKGISLPALQKMLGHENLQTTAIYLNLSPEEALREYKEKW
jgi:integrase/recombinase XerD